MDLVVKVGGGLLAHAGRLDGVLAVVEEAARLRQLLIVPGGGPFADAVREVDRRVGLSEDAAHWMAVLAMDQYAHVLASRLRRGACVAGLGDARTAVDRRQVPVLAPFRWLQEADPLPHTWDVTSDSIAAWVAGQARARRLVLVKPPGAGSGRLVDACFDRALPEGVAAIAVAADRLDQLRSALENPRSG
jgi:aspartokinase-like uncharacterized kinase